MKQNVQCPKCEAKLSVFVLGKPITQKCPKCGNTFEVSPDGTVTTPSAETPSSAPVAETAEKEKSASAPAAPKPSAAREEARSAEARPPAPESVVAESGITFLHVLVIFALLFVIIVVQVVTFKKTQNHLNFVTEQIQSVQKKAGN
jgi:phage FluMu protein Com